MKEGKKEIIKERRNEKEILKKWIKAGKYKAPYNALLSLQSTLFASLRCRRSLLSICFCSKQHLTLCHQLFVSARTSFHIKSLDSLISVSLYLPCSPFYHFTPNTPMKPLRRRGLLSLKEYKYIYPGFTTESGCDTSLGLMCGTRTRIHGPKTNIPRDPASVGCADLGASNDPFL